MDGREGEELGWSELASARARGSDADVCQSGRSRPGGATWLREERKGNFAEQGARGLTGAGSTRESLHGAEDFGSDSDRERFSVDIKISRVVFEGSSQHDEDIISGTRVKDRFQLVREQSRMKMLEEKLRLEMTVLSNISDLADASCVIIVLIVLILHCGMPFVFSPHDKAGQDCRAGNRQQERQSV
eukprot:341725-Hanusia_phi.AAC.1